MKTNRTDWMTYVYTAVSADRFNNFQRPGSFPASVFAVTWTFPVPLHFALATRFQAESFIVILSMRKKEDLGPLTQHNPSGLAFDLICAGQENSAELVISQRDKKRAPSSAHALWLCPQRADKPSY